LTRESVKEKKKGDGQKRVKGDVPDQRLTSKVCKKKNQSACGGALKDRIPHGKKNWFGGGKAGKPDRGGERD